VRVLLHQSQLAMTSPQHRDVDMSVMMDMVAGRGIIVRMYMDQTHQEVREPTIASMSVMPMQQHHLAHPVQRNPQHQAVKAATIKHVRRSHHSIVMTICEWNHAHLLVATLEQMHRTCLQQVNNPRMQPEEGVGGVSSKMAVQRCWVVDVDPYHHRRMEDRQV